MIEPISTPRHFATRSHTQRAIEIDYVTVRHQHVRFLNTSGLSSDCDASYPFDPRNLAILDLEDEFLLNKVGDFLLDKDGNVIGEA